MGADWLPHGEWMWSWMCLDSLAYNIIVTMTPNGMFSQYRASVNLRFLQVSPGLQGWCLPGCSSHLNMGRVDVASVVLLGWYQLYSGIIIGKHILESISFCIFRQPGCWALPIDQPLFKNPFIFGEDHSLLQALFQNLALEDRRRVMSDSHMSQLSGLLRSCLLPQGLAFSMWKILYETKPKFYKSQKLEKT